MVDLLLILLLSVLSFSVFAMVREFKKDARQRDLDTSFSVGYEGHLQWIAEETASHRPGTFKEFLSCFEKVKGTLTREDSVYGPGYVENPLQFPTKVNPVEVLFSGVGFKFATLREYAQFRSWLSCTVLEEGGKSSRSLGGSW